jgi:hypothetical protein
MPFWAVTSFVYEVSCFLVVVRYLDEISCFLATEFPFFLMVRCKDGGEVDVERGGRLMSVHDGLLDVVWFCVCVSWVFRWRGMKVS